MAWWIPPTRSAAEATYPGNRQGVPCLSRLVILPDTPKNACTFLLSRPRKTIDSKRRPCLVTYADDRKGHTGAIHLADNWQFIGKTKPGRTYTIGTRMTSRKAGGHTRTHAEMPAPGAVSRRLLRKVQVRQNKPSNGISTRRTTLKRVFKTQKNDHDRQDRIQKSRGMSAKRNNQPTQVYVISSGDFIRIGIASNLYFRFARIQSSNPVKINPAYRSVMTPRVKAGKIEVACHTHLINLHVHGEWFQADARMAMDFLNAVTERDKEPEVYEPIQLRLVG